MKVLAIVIGNNDYPDPDKLTNAVDDAKAMCDVFVRLGYNVIPFYDFHKPEIPVIMETLEKELSNCDASIFYYAGHGFQIDGENYLPSVDCQISYATKYQLRYDGLVLSELLDIYRPYSNNTHIIILDACRIRPSNRGNADSFAPIEAPQGTLIAFSTSPNSVAKDGGAGGHSLYTAAILSYIGRERMTVEELFKKVRRTVAQWSNNTQIPWEHTSLIGDFKFNTGQMVVSPQIPYKENVVKDAFYDEVGEIPDLIKEIRVLDYYRQNAAIDRLRLKPVAQFDKNQLFLFGRNLLQSSAWSFSAQTFMNTLANNLSFYSAENGENHLLNGILFEIYFDKHGEFRGSNIKRNQYFEIVLSLRKRVEFAKSFEFIRAALSPYKDLLLYCIPEDDAKLDVDVLLREESVKNAIGEELTYSIVNSISINGVDITERVGRCHKSSGLSLNESVAIVTNAPYDAIDIHSNLPLQIRVAFEEKEEDNPF